VTDRLYRSTDDRMLAGVAGGVAETLDADPSLIRIVWALLIVLTGGIALIVYVVMAIVVPERPPGMPVGGPGPLGGASEPATPVPEGAWRAADGSTVPLATSATAPARRRDPADRTRGGLIAGLLLILLGGFFLARQLLPSIDWSLWWPIVAIAAGIVLVFAALLPPRRPG
jgi:phage shock protein C